MATAVFIALGLLVYQAKSQICGPGLFPGLLGLDGFGPGPCGPLPPQIGPLSPQIGPISCGQPAPCGIQPCGLPTPGIVGPYGFQGPISPPVGIPPCTQVPCGIPGCAAKPPCGVQVPQCGVQVPQCGVQVPQCGVQVPQCGVQVPQCLQAPIINAPSIPNPCQCSFPNQCNQCIATIPSCDYVQGPVTTVIDNTLANSLANALQLLIVSNLLDNSLAPCLPYTCDVPNYGNVIEYVPDYPCSQFCEPVYEVVTPITQYIEIPCQSPCVEVPVCCDNYGLVNPYANSFGNCGFDSLVNPYSNNYGFLDCGCLNPYANGYGCLDSVFSPVAAEVLFPAEIPAQLTCNFGYMTSNVPCVSVNVEALPFNPCCC